MYSLVVHKIYDKHFTQKEASEGKSGCVLFAHEGGQHSNFLRNYEDTARTRREKRRQRELQGT